MITLIFASCLPVVLRTPGHSILTLFQPEVCKLYGIFGILLFKPFSHLRLIIANVFGNGTTCFCHPHWYPHVLIYNLLHLIFIVSFQLRVAYSCRCCLLGYPNFHRPLLTLRPILWKLWVEKQLTCGSFTASPITPSDPWYKRRCASLYPQ